MPKCVSPHFHVIVWGPSSSLDGAASFVSRYRLSSPCGEVYAYRLQGTEGQSPPRHERLPSVPVSSLVQATLTRWLSMFDLQNMHSMRLWITLLEEVAYALLVCRMVVDLMHFYMWRDVLITKNQVQIWKIIRV